VFSTPMSSLAWVLQPSHLNVSWSYRTYTAPVAQHGICTVSTEPDTANRRTWLVQPDMFVCAAIYGYIRRGALVLPLPVWAAIYLLLGFLILTLVAN